MYQRGKTYEEIEIGDKASFAKTITETDIYLFAGISGDFNPLHVDEEYAKTTIFGTRIAHGGLAASLLAPVLGMKLPGLGTVALETVTKFRKPVYPGDTVTCTVEVKNKVERMRMVEMKILWTNQKGETIGKGECKVLPPGSNSESVIHEQK
ncbi:MaoC-like protein [Leptospira weilii serovar Ranarum str. ICFT]|uniref:MaoC-like protein n=1 Tax=Leptospira weilii serovar Ranarum str. ICFT TaxID=1218598 RepID=N1WHE1_9LEPT|nr:MaoC family dehydratase [Leptospira weilii]EMY76752.1 MaoC-like protein [Leptospira weilii serovar Ranarum str. ICFT]